MVSVLDRKVLRDLWTLRAQVISIALLIASGIAILVMSVSNYLALVEAMDQHYRAERFGDLFAAVKRAPLTLVDRVQEIDGIGVVEPRITQPVRISWPSEELPIAGRIISLPATDQPMLNRLHLVEGSWIDPMRRDEIIINAAFAQARLVRPGDSIDVILNGRLQTFRVAGIAFSPEFVFATRGGLPLPDDRNFAVLWAGMEAVASAFDMKGAFNDLVMAVGPGASSARIIADVDHLLAPYGGIGAYDRGDLASHRFLQDELAEQETLSIVMPAVFFGIAAFLLNVVLGRMIEAQREQIASLKALGFPNRPIAIHYLKFVTVVVLIGAAIGVALGAVFAGLVIESYRPFFRFPVLQAQLQSWIIVLAVGASLLAAYTAVAHAVFRIARMPPAEAMRPAVPLISTRLPQLASGNGRWLSIKFVMALRSIVGRPVRTILTVVGIALSAPMVLFGLFWFDAIAYMLDVSFERIERGDAFVVFSAPTPARAARELGAIPGVLLAEGQRIVPVQLSAGHRRYRTSIVGLAAGSELKILRTPDLAPIDLPAVGIMLSRPLADKLGVGIGATITVEILEGERPMRELPILRLSDDILGFSATMDIRFLNQILREDGVINAAALKIDSEQATDVWRRLQEFPKIEAASVKSLWLSLFNDTIAGMVVVGAAILAGFGILIAVGVVYNSARVALQERAWELASLRILGFTRGEVTTLLLTELAFALVAAIPLGLYIGRGLIHVIISARARESFQIPAVIEPASYAMAALVVFAAAAASALLVRRRIDALDLVGVLKTRD